MLLSYRRHAPRLLPGAEISVARLVSEHWVVRCTRGEGLVQDERLLMNPQPPGRSKLLVVLRGRCTVFVGDDAHELTVGQAVAVRDLDSLRLRSTSGLETLEFDWSPGRGFGPEPGARLECGAVGATTLHALRSLREGMHTGRTDAGLFEGLTRGLGALRSEGLGVDERRIEPVAEPASEPVPTQRVLSLVDRTLSRLDQNPDAEEMASEMGQTRRTLHRHLQAMAGRNLLVTGEWRAQRDQYRLLLATVYLSHPAATARLVARLVGYRSAEALCHALARQGLPAPMQLRRELRG